MTAVKCPKCGCQVEVPCAVKNYWKGRKLSIEHKRNLGASKRKWWASLPKERQLEIRRKQIEGRARAMARKTKPPQGKRGFIGMLGDIEVYELFNGVGRSPKSVSSKWARPAHGKPELKARKRDVG